MKEFEVVVKNSWIESKTISLTIEASSEDEARDLAISEARSSHTDDWSSIDTNEFIEEIEEVNEL